MVIIILSVFVFLMLNTSLHHTNRTKILQNWFLFYNVEILRYNYVWELSIMNSAISKDPKISEYFKNNGAFQNVPYENIIQIPK